MNLAYFIYIAILTCVAYWAGYKRAHKKGRELGRAEILEENLIRAEFQNDSLKKLLDGNIDPLP